MGRGNFKKKLIAGVGINDCSESVHDENGKLNKAYTVWKSMIHRCYSDNYHIRNPAYKGCAVCNDWHRLSNFKAWFYENYVEGYQLDKDILVEGNTVYSPETCCFIPGEINKLFESKKKTAELPIGIQLDTYRNKYMVAIGVNGKLKHVGRFNTLEEAIVARNKAKYESIKELIDKYKSKGNIPDKVYNAILRKLDAYKFYFN